MKMKIGREPERDLHRITEVQKALTAAEVVRGCQRGISREDRHLAKREQFGDLGVVWFEEPVSVPMIALGFHLRSGTLSGK